MTWSEGLPLFRLQVPWLQKGSRTRPLLWSVDSFFTAGKARQEACGEEDGGQEKPHSSLSSQSGRTGGDGCKARRITQRTQTLVSGSCGSSARGQVRFTSALCCVRDGPGILSTFFLQRPPQSSHWPAKDQQAEGPTFPCEGFFVVAPHSAPPRGLVPKTGLFHHFLPLPKAPSLPLHPGAARPAHGLSSDWRREAAA